MTIKFRAKLMLSYLLLVLLVSAAFYTFYSRNMRTSLVEESRATLSSQAALVRMLVERSDKSLSLQRLAESIGATVKARVTLVAPDGIVRGDSDVSAGNLAALENHLDRPEIRAAQTSGQGCAVRYSETIKRDMLYVAIASDPKTTGVAYIRLALPLDYLAHVTHELQHALGAVALLTILAAGLLSYLLSSIASRPLRQMALAAGRIGRGEPGITLNAGTHDEVGELAEVLNDMSRRIDEQVQRISAEKQRLDTILNGMSEGVMVAAGSGVITLVNPAFQALFGIEDQAEGKSLIEISRHPGLLAAFQELRRSDEAELIREICLGQTTLLTHWALLPAGASEPGVVAVFHDISDMKRMENMRRDFVANVSHELRTPVTVVKGYAETLLDGLMESDPQRARRSVEIIGAHAERLSVLINDILTLSQLESKEAALHLTALDPAATTARACHLLEERIQRKRITLNNELDQGAIMVMADQGRLEQVLVNLLENAVKYTPENGTIRIFLDDAGPLVKVSVSDTGIGIPAKDLDRIFERFYRVDEARSREQGGTGLGLAIVKHIVHLHGGTVGVTSIPGRGSVFSFILKKASSPF